MTDRSPKPLHSQALKQNGRSLLSRGDIDFFCFHALSESDMNDITVGELETAKEELESSLEEVIKDHVDDFEEETGVDVSEITVALGPSFGAVGRQDGRRVGAKATLDLPF